MDRTEGTNPSADRSPAVRIRCWTAFGFEAGILVVALLLGWVTTTSPLATIAWTGRSVAVGMIGLLPMLLLLVVLDRVPWPPVRRTRDTVVRVVTELFAGCGPVQIALVSLAAGLGEEALFRGVLQVWLGDLLSPATGLLLASVAFGLVHFVSVTYAIAATLIGVYLGVLYLETGNLLVPVLVHAVYDFVAILYVRACGQSVGPSGSRTGGQSL